MFPHYRKVLFMTAMALCLSLLCVPSPGEGRTMDELFMAREWAALDDLLGKKGGQLSPRELSLAANSLWYRGRWAESLELFQKTAPHWPEAVKPYGRLVTLLGLERTGRTEEAIAYGEKILPQASGETGYYIAYALYRMTPEKDAAAKKEYLQKMYSHAVNQSQQTSALTGLLALPGDKTAYALLRILTPLIKFRACRDARKATGDAMEVRGGCGYIEEWSDPRIVRDAHLGSIWEGTSNIVALDVMRAIQREGSLPVWREQLLAQIAATPWHPAARARLLALLDAVQALAAQTAQARDDRLARQAASALYHLT